MLSNNNKAIINKLAKNSVKSNKKKYGILFFTIVLSAFMLFCVFTIGLTYLDSSRLQNTRLYGAEYDITTMNGFTPEQLNTLQQNENIKNVGKESYAGFIKSSEFDKTVAIGLLWCDEVFWDKLMSPARTKLDGRYPQNKNELMVTKDILKACGNENLSVGDRLVLTYENNTGVHTDEFVISGIWDGYGDRSVGFVSEAFYDETGYDLKNDGILCIKLNRNYVLPTTIQSIEKSLDFTDRQIFAPTEYIENSFKLLLGICGLALVICLSAYLLIYNILYLSVSGKIRYYGSLIVNSSYSNDLYIESQYEDMKTIQESQGNMMEIGTIIALLLLLVGVLNYANTIASGIQNRKLTFSVMESVGMSRKQINRLLIREGVLYAMFSVLITLTIGSAITYVCFQSMNYMEISFEVPAIPLIGAIVLVMLICTIVPLLSYKKLAGNRSIVERLRDYE